MTLSSNPRDEELLDQLRFCVSVIRKKADWRGSPPYSIQEVLKTIFERACAADSPPQVFKPVIDAMSGLAYDERLNPQEIANALAEPLTDEKNNPWRALAKGKKGDPELYDLPRNNQDLKW